MTRREGDETLDFGTPAPEPGECICDEPVVNYRQFESVRSGVDKTDGRYADVTIRRCLTCQGYWAHYQVEYEYLTRAGRWARGRIPDDLAERIAGGSYFDSTGFRRRGWMPW